MDNKTIIIDDYIAEASAAAAMEFAASALNSAIHTIIHESGSITADEVKTISGLYEKVITEAMEEFVPSDEEIAKLKSQLEAAGYKVIKADEVPAAEIADAVKNGEEAPVQEGADLAAAIAAKLQIL